MEIQKAEAQVRLISDTRVPIDQEPARLPFRAEHDLCPLASSAGPKFAHPIVTLIGCLVLVVIITIILTFIYGELAAAAWVGAGGAIASVLVVFVLPQLGQRQKIYKGPRHLKLWHGGHARDRIQ
jgi:hypothetical protein